MVAMKGKDCVAIASDRRFGVRAQTVSIDFPKMFKVGPRLYLGLPGLGTDTQTVHQRLQFRYEPYNQKCAITFNIIEFIQIESLRIEREPKHHTPDILLDGLQHALRAEIRSVLHRADHSRFRSGHIRTLRLQHGLGKIRFSQIKFDFIPIHHYRLAASTSPKIL
jgi:hypothetical protein